MKTRLIILIFAGLMMVFGASAAFAQPQLEAMINHNWIRGYYFPANTDISVGLAASNGDAKDNFAVTTDNGGNFHVQINGYGTGQFLETGDQIRAVFNATTVSMTIQNLMATVDIDANTITGQAFAPVPGNSALNGRMVTVDIHDSWDQNSQFRYHGQTLVQEDGTFIFNDLTASGYQLVRGHAIFMTLYDAPDGSTNGNRTSIEAYNGIPQLVIWFQNNFIEGLGFPFNTTVTISINGDETKTVDIQTDNNGNFIYNPWNLNHDFAFGDTVAVTFSNSQFVSVIIPGLPILLQTATADPSTNTVSGDEPALSGKDLLVKIYTNTGPYDDTIPVGADGLFSKVLSYDFVPGETVNLGVTDDSGDIVFFNAYNGIPFLQAMIEHNWISGGSFPPGREMTIDISGGVTAHFTISTDNRGFFWLNNQLWNYQQLSPGDDILVSLGNNQSAFMEILNFSAAVDVAGNRVTGCLYGDSKFFCCSGCRRQPGYGYRPNTRRATADR